MKKVVYALASLALAILALLGGLIHLRPSLVQTPPGGAAGHQPREIGQPGLSLVFFGTSTVLLSDGEHAILTDGFFSRPSWLRLLLTRFESNPDEIDFALKQGNIKKVDAIFVAHSHHDHAMDSGLVAQKTGAVVHGSESTLNIARGQKTPEGQLRLLKAGQPLMVGQFRITAYETPHSPEPINTGHIDQPLHSPAKLSSYRMGENYSFLAEHPLGNVLIVPSANYKPNAFDGVQAKAVVLGIGLLGKQSAEFTERYWNEVVRKTGAKLVVPVHWDDFARPLSEPLVPLPYFMDNMGVAMERLGMLAKRDGVVIRFLPPMKEVRLPVQGDWQGF